MSKKINKKILRNLDKKIKKVIKHKKVLGAGKRRVVYDVGNGKVLKVAKDKKGLKININEYKIYKSCPSSLKKHLAEITDHGKGWLEMVKYKREFPKSKKYKKMLFKLISKFKKEGIKPSDLHHHHNKPKRANLRLRKKGKIVVIDYGNFEIKKRKK